jgi:hypothetical protein
MKRTITHASIVRFTKSQRRRCLWEECSEFSLSTWLGQETTLIRDVFRLLAGDNHSIVIVDTSREIGGAGEFFYSALDFPVASN